MKEAVAGQGLPVPIGPYSAAVRQGSWVFVSGQIAPEVGGVENQTERSLEQISKLLAAAGLGMDDVLKTTVFLTDLKLFSAMNEVYARYFQAPFPARATVEVSALPKGVLVEIEAVACAKNQG